MKKVLFTFIMLLVASVASASSISWSMPTMYTDSTTIPVADRARITTKLFYGTSASACTAATTAFATGAAGVTSWTGTLPVITKGSTTYYCATATLDGGESAKSPTVAHTIPFGSPGPPSLINIVQ